MSDKAFATAAVWLSLPLILSVAPTALTGWMGWYLFGMLFATGIIW